MLVLGTLAVRHAAASAGRVRRRFAEDLARLDLPNDLIQDGALLLSEMVGNAVRYAEPLPGDVLLVGWGLVQGRLLLRVTDGGGRHQPHVRDAGPLDTRGRGLTVVEAIATAWGVKHRRTAASRSCTVWAALPIRHHPAGAPVVAPADPAARAVPAATSLATTSSRRPRWPASTHGNSIATAGGEPHGALAAAN